MSDFSEMAKRLRDLTDDLRDEHKEATRDATRSMRTQTRVQLVRNDSVARGVNGLLGDIRERRGDSDPAVLTARTVDMPEWAKYLDRGTGARGASQFKAPSNPPYQAIRKWAHAKPIVPDEYDTIDEAAGAIANTIAEVGTFGHPFISETWNGPRGYRHVVDKNHQAMKRALRRL